MAAKRHATHNRTDHHQPGRSRFGNHRRDRDTSHDRTEVPRLKADVISRRIDPVDRASVDQGTIDQDAVIEAITRTEARNVGHLQVDVVALVRSLFGASWCLRVLVAKFGVVLNGH